MPPLAIGTTPPPRLRARGGPRSSESTERSFQGRSSANLQKRDAIQALLYAPQEMLPSPSARAREDWLAEVAKDEQERLREVSVLRFNSKEESETNEPSSPEPISESTVSIPRTRSGDRSSVDSRGRSRARQPFLEDSALSPSSIPLTTKRLLRAPQSTLGDSAPRASTGSISPIPIAQEDDEDGDGVKSVSSQGSSPRLNLIPRFPGPQGGLMQSRLDAASANEEVRQLQAKIVELERREVETLEKCEQRLRAQAENETKLAREVALLTARLETMQMELDMSREAEIRSRSERAWAEERAVKLEASCAVMEARLSTSTRRQKALEATLADIEESNKASGLALAPPPPLPTVTVQDQEHVAHLEKKIVYLEEKLKETTETQKKLEADLAKAQDDCEKAEWSRVACEKRAEDLETQLEHYKHQSRGLQDRISLLSNMSELLEKEKKEVEGQRTEADNEIVELRKEMEEQRRRFAAQKSEANHATRKLLMLLDESVADFDAILSLGEFRLGNRPLDINVILDTAPSGNRDPSALLGLYFSLADRARRLKSEVIEDLAEDRGKHREAEQIVIPQLRGGHKQREKATIPVESRCGVQ